jgi:hypothetical protein
VTQGDDSDFALNLRPLVANAGERLGFSGALGGARGELMIADGTMQEGTLASMLLGFVVGYVLGFIAIFLTLSGQQSRRFRLGIFVGIAMNIFTTTQGAANDAAANDTGGAGSEAAGAAAKNDSPWSAAAASIINK